MKNCICLLLFISILQSCKKTDTEVKPVEDKVSFTISPNSLSSTFTTPYDTISFKISISSKIPDLGFKISLNVFDSDKKQTFTLDTSSNSNTISILTKNYELNKGYTVKITVTSKSQTTNTFTKEVLVERKRVYKNYLKTSYELSNFDNWYSSDELWENDSKFTKENPFSICQTTQLDIDGNGLEDVITYESSPGDLLPVPNPPPIIFMNNGVRLDKTQWKGPQIRNPHGVKLLVGDFNNDSFPDIFSLVDIDQPFGAPPTLKDNCHLVFNSENGFNRVLEFDDEGFWVTGCSGDIDKDGDLDIVMFNFHYQGNGVKSKIQWNDGKGNFTPDANGIGEISTVQESELVDVNGDGWLDLVIDYVKIISGVRTPTVAVMWGNGRGFSLSNSNGWEYSGQKFMMNLDFADIDGDKVQEIFISGITTPPNYYIEIYKSDDGGKTWIDKTTQYFENTQFGRFGHMVFKDIDKNGKLDIFTNDKKSNIRWEWNGSKFMRK